jgi:hypothetical protein
MRMIRIADAGAKHLETKLLYLAMENHGGAEGKLTSIHRDKG